MKKVYNFFALVILLFIGVITNAQTITASTYPFSNAAGIALENMSTGTTQLIGASSDDGASTLTNIGFTFYYAGAGYTQFTASANGYVRLGAAITSPGAAVDYTNSMAVNQFPAIAPYWDDLATGTTGNVLYKLTGSAPNRKLIIQWAVTVPRATAAAANATFQLWLSESGRIDFVYGNGMVVNATNLGASIGITKAATDFASITSSTNSVSYATPNNTNTTAIAAGVQYSFIPVLVSPAAPVNISFSAVTPASMTVNWIDNSTDETSFIIMRSTAASGPFVQVGTVPSTSTAGTGTAYSLNNTGLFANTTYYFQITATNAGNPPSAELTGNEVTSIAPTVISTTTGGLWSAPSTWAGGAVPTASDEVIIADGATVIIDIAAVAYSVTVGQGGSGILQYEDAVARTLTIGADVTISGGGSFLTGATGSVTTHVLSVTRNLTNDGTLDFALGTAGTGITFTGNGNSFFSGGGGSLNLYSILPSKTSINNEIEINVPVMNVRGMATGATGALLTSGVGTGTLKFSGGNTFSGTLWSIPAYNIPATLGFWLNNPNFTVNGLAGSSTVNGRLRISAGTYNIGTASGESMAFNAGSNITVEGGSVNTTGRFGVGAAANIFTYTQTGGTVTVNTIGNTSTTLASFDLGTSNASTITISGGTIITQLANTAATTPRDYRNQAGSGIPGVTAGTLQLGNSASGTAKTFNIAGVVPNLVVTNTSANHSAVFGTPVTYNNITQNITINPGNTVNFGNFVFLFNGTTLTNNGTITHNGASSNFVTFNTVAPVLYTGTGVVTAPMTALALQSTAGFTVDPSSANIITNAVRLFNGNVTNANKITVGNGGATTGAVQIGNTTTPTPAGTFDVPLTFNAGTGGYTLFVGRTNTVTRTLNNEIPPSRILTTLTLDDNDATHSLTLGGGNLTVSSGAAPTFNFSNGKLDLNGSMLTLGLNGTTAALAGVHGATTSGYMYNGQYKRWISATTGNRDFPMGTASAKKNASINFTTVPATAGSLTASWSSVSPTFPNAVPLMEGAILIDDVSNQGSWFLDAGDLLAGGAYTGTFTANGTTDVVNPAGVPLLVLVKRPNGPANDWTLNGTHVTTTGTMTAPVLQRTGMTGFSEFTIGGQAVVVLPIAIDYFRGSKVAGANFLDWKVNCTSSPSVTLILERSSDGRNFKALNTQTESATRCLQSFNYTDASPLAGINYYRLKTITPDGEFKYSVIVALLNQSKGFELISLAPNPVKSVSVLSLSSVKGGRIDISVTDMTGKVVLNQSVTVIAGNNPVQMNCSKLGAGTYNITAVNAENEKRTTRFIKY